MRFRYAEIMAWLESMLGCTLNSLA
jgi:hypothetical protein